MARGEALNCNWRGPLALQSTPEFWLCPRTHSRPMARWATGPVLIQHPALLGEMDHCSASPDPFFSPFCSYGTWASGETENLFLCNRSPNILSAHPDLENKCPLGSACPHHRECGVFLKGAEGKATPEERQHCQIPWILTSHLLPGIFQSSFASPQQGPLSL